MNWIDMAIIVIALIGAFIGLSHGLFRAVFTAAGLVVGVLLAGQYYEPFAEVLSPDGASWAGIAAFAIILVIVLVIANLIGAGITKFFRAMMLGWVDKLAGFILGVGIGGIFCAAILTILAKYGILEESISDSGLAVLLMDQFPLLLDLLPEEFDFIRDFFGQSEA